jgi:hypothetical protein
MADVTINSVKRNVNGFLREYYYNVTGASGSTLPVGFNKVNIVDSGGGVITAYTVAARTVPGTSVITLTGTMNNTDIRVTGN